MRDAVHEAGRGDVRAACGDFRSRGGRHLQSRAVGHAGVGICSFVWLSSLLLVDSRRKQKKHDAEERLWQKTFDGGRDRVRGTRAVENPSQ